MDYNNCLIVVVLITTPTHAQWSSNKKVKGNGKVIAQIRTIASYDAILVTGVFNVELVSGKKENITVKGEENTLPLIQVEIVDQQLKIYI